MSRIELLAIAGSLRAVSSNRTLLQAAVELAPPEVTVRPSNHLALLPHFNPDLDGEARPPAAAAWRVAAPWNVSARGTYATASLVEILRTMSTRIVDEAGVTLPLLDSPLDLRTLVNTPALREMLRAALAAFVRAIREHPAHQP